LILMCFNFLKLTLFFLMNWFLLEAEVWNFCLHSWFLTWNLFFNSL
jgi:hypothetical protein